MYIDDVGLIHRYLDEEDEVLDPLLRIGNTWWSGNDLQVVVTEEQANKHNERIAAHTIKRLLACVPSSSGACLLNTLPLLVYHSSNMMYVETASGDRVGNICMLTTDSGRPVIMFKVADESFVGVCGPRQSVMVVGIEINGHAETTYAYCDSPTGSDCADVEEQPGDSGIGEQPSEEGGNEAAA